MIKSLSSKALRLFYLKNDGSKLPALHLKKISLVLSLLEAAAVPEDIEFPGSNFHKLTGDLKDFYSVKISGNYRIIFQFENGNAYNVDYLDYH